MPIGINPAFPVAGSPTTSSVRDNFSAAKSGIDNLQYATVDAVTATGTADAMVATYVIKPSLVDGLEITVKSIGANTVAGPTVSLADGPAIALYTNEGDALPIGGIPSADYYIRLRYDADNTRYIVMNPAVSTASGLDTFVQDLIADEVGVTVQAYDANTAVTDEDQSFSGEQTFTSVKETVFTLATSSGTIDLDPANGTIQLKALTGDTTFTVTSFESGHSITLMLNNSSASVISWPSSIYWANGETPAVSETAYTTIVLWQVGSSVYGASLGDMEQAV